MEIIEIKDVLINNKKINLVKEHLVDILESDRKEGFVKITIDLNKFKLPLFGSDLSKTICTEQDLQKSV